MGADSKYRQLEVWKLGMEVVGEVYRLSRGCPPEERYGLTAQLRRAALSLPGNIAEGNARGTRRDHAESVAIATGSCAEAETLLLVAAHLGYVREEEASASLDDPDRVGRMLRSLRRKLLLHDGIAVPRSPIPHPPSP